MNVSSGKRWGGIVACLLLGACAVNGSGPDQAIESSWPVGWIDADGDCQDSETEVLIREVDGLLRWGDPEACTIASGSWRSWASDRHVTFNSLLVVPLVMPGNAEASGATGWSQDRKRTFLNDLDNLITLDVTSAEQRADAGPEKWRPHEKYWCEYAARWQLVKARYSLEMMVEEQKALEEMLAGCTD